MIVDKSCQCLFFSNKSCAWSLILLTGQQALLDIPPCMIFACIYYFEEEYCIHTI